MVENASVSIVDAVLDISDTTVSLVDNLVLQRITLLRFCFLHNHVVVHHAVNHTVVSDSIVGIIGIL